MMSAVEQVEGAPRRRPVGPHVPADRAMTPLLFCVDALMQFYGRKRHLSALKYGVASSFGDISRNAAVEMLEQQGVSAEWRCCAIVDVLPELFPLIVELEKGQYCLLESPPVDGDMRLSMLESPASTAPDSVADLYARATGMCLFSKPPKAFNDRSIDSEKTVADGGWLFGTLKLFRGFYVQAIVVSVVANVLAIAGSFYSMSVYDRVIPHKGYSTLIALTIGVLVAIMFEIGLRCFRASLLEKTARRADYLLSRKVFQHLQASRLENMPPSSGALANVIREYESVRDFLTSATLTGVADLPFVFVFVGLIAWIGGWLAIVPVILIAVMAIGLLLAQRPLTAHANAQFGASSARHGLLVETIEGLEAIKSVRGEGLQLTKWDSYNVEIGQHGYLNRIIQSNVGLFVTAVQQGGNILLMCVGGYMAAEGHFTTGVLLASTIMNGRIMAPIAQVGGLAARYQHAKKAFEVLNKFMSSPSERVFIENKFVPVESGEGRIEIENADYTYPEGSKRVLSRVSLAVAPGTHLAILGEVGSGKSTLLRLLAGLYQPQSGMVKLDGVDIQQLHPAYIRSRVGFLSQEPRLFSGTLRENLLMGHPVSNDWFVQVMANTGVQAIASSHPHGYDMAIGNRGGSLSGGQKQLVAWARMLLQAPDVIFMDEPTSALDPEAEKRFFDVMRAYLKGRTAVLITHKLSLLELVDEVAVIKKGRIDFAGPKQNIVRKPVGVAPKVETEAA